MLYFFFLKKINLNQGKNNNIHLKIYFFKYAAYLGVTKQSEMIITYVLSEEIKVKINFILEDNLLTDYLSMFIYG